MLKNWLKIFVYNFLQNKLFSLLTVLGLAIGMTGVVLASLYWEDEHAYNKWVPDKDRIAEVTIEFRENKWAWMVAPLGAMLKERSAELDSYLYYASQAINEPYRYRGKSTFIKNILDAQQNFFDFFPFEIVQGDLNQYKENSKAVALEASVAREIFGDENPIGKIITNSYNNERIVAAVYKLNDKTSVKPNMLLHDMDNTIKNGVQSKNMSDFNYGLLVKAKTVGQLEAVQRSLNVIMDEFFTNQQAQEAGISKDAYEEKYGKFAFHLTILANSRLDASDMPTGLPEGKGNRTFLIINVGLCILILVISIFNYINLSTAYAMKRAKEIGVRKVIGATRKDVILQMVLETALTALIAILLTFALVEVLLPLYNSLLDKQLTMDFGQYGLHFLGLLLVIILLAGVLPALYIAKFEILKVVKGNFSRSQSGIWIRNTMIVLQFCIATFFIISGIVVSLQVKFAMEKDLGFNGDQIISIEWPNQYNNKFKQFQQIRQELNKIAGVADVSTSSFVIGTGAASSSAIIYRDKNVQSQNIAIDFNTLDMYGIKIVQGRKLQPSLSSDTIHSVLLNKTALEAIGEKDPLNKKINRNGQELTIVGIVDDFHLFGLDNKVPPMTIFHFNTIPWMQSNINSLVVKVKPEHMDKTISAIESYWKKNVDAERPFAYDFVDKAFARTYQQYVKQRNVFNILTVVVISISLLGLFALASYTMERRYKEIAIKKVLGAETRELVVNLIKQYLVLLVAGFVIAVLPSFYLMQKWLSNFAYRIDLPLYAFPVSLLMMLGLTLAVVLSKAIAATRINSLTYLKYE